MDKNVDIFPEDTHLREALDDKTNQIIDICAIAASTLCGIGTLRLVGHCTKAACESTDSKIMKALIFVGGWCLAAAAHEASGKTLREAASVARFGLIARKATKEEREKENSNGESDAEPDTEERD